MLDGVVQITEADEFVYQEMMAHVPLLNHGAAARVLVIGGGDGGILRRVLQHKTVRRAVLVEIDEQVIALSKAHLPGIGGDAWTDPRAEVVVGDAIHYVAAAPSGAFDAIIVDSTDPAGVGEVLFTEDFYRECARVLGDGGVVVNQGGVPFMQGDELRLSSARRAAFFADTHAYLIAVPTYVGGFMAIGWGAKDRACRAAPAASFDAIIVDSTDPAGVGEVLFTAEFYRERARVLTDRGVVVNQGGVPFMQGGELRLSSARRAAFFPDTHAYIIAVPTYVGGFMAIGWGAKDPGCRGTLSTAEVEQRAASAGILGTTRYWTPEIHVGAFNLPPYIADCLRPR